MTDYNWWGDTWQKGVSRARAWRHMETPNVITAWDWWLSLEWTNRTDSSLSLYLLYIRCSLVCSCAHCIPSQMDWLLALLPLCLLEPLRRRCSPVTETMGAKVSTMIFCEVFLKLSQSIDLNILLALLISCVRKGDVSAVLVVTFLSYLWFAPGNNEGRLEVISGPGASLAHHQVLPLPLLLK